jgi:hypothetical protein
MAKSTNPYLTEVDKDYNAFVEHVRKGAESYINAVKQNSCAAMNDDWWKKAHTQMLKTRKEHKFNNHWILHELNSSILTALPATLFDEEGKHIFVRHMFEIFIPYNAIVKDTCYCYDTLCLGDCGVLPCGCIDCCRCGWWRGRY